MKEIFAKGTNKLFLLLLHSWLAVVMESVMESLFLLCAGFMSAVFFSFNWDVCLKSVCSGFGVAVVGLAVRCAMGVFGLHDGQELILIE